MCYMQYAIRMEIVFDFGKIKIGLILLSENYTTIFARAREWIEIFDEEQNDDSTGNDGGRTHV